MYKCILVSYFNSNNIGDTLIANTLYKDVVSCGYEVYKCSYEGSFIIQEHIGGKTGGNSALLLVKSLIHNLLSFKYVNKMYNIIIKKLFWIEFTRRIKKCDVFIIGGGNMIMDLSPETNAASHFRQYIDIAKKNQKMVIVLAIGIGPFQTPHQEESTIEILNKCDYVTYRDEESFCIGSRRISSTKHFISADPVFVIPKVETAQQKDKRIIGIGVINTLLFDKSIDRYNYIMQGYVELIKALVSENYNIVVFSTEKADYNMVEDVVRICDDNRVSRVDIQSQIELFELYSNKLSFLISARMHSLIIAFTQYIPIVGLSWQRKVNSMFRIINMKESCFSIDCIKENIENILDIVDKVIDNDNRILKTKHTLKDIKTKYDVNLEILRHINTKNEKTNYCM